MTVHYDIHLSAGAITFETIQSLGRLGMTEDYLRNNLNSVTPHYHGSMPHMDEPNEELWRELKKVLSADSRFRGALEFEQNDSTLCYRFETPLTTAPSNALPFRLEKCKPGEHKACDVHLRVDPVKTTPGAIEELKRFNFISFERLVGGVWYPVYSLTFENLTVGKAVMSRLVTILESIPGLVAKMKLERIHDFWVHPDDAHQLPIVRNTDAEDWLSGMK